MSVAMEPTLYFQKEMHTLRKKLCMYMFYKCLFCLMMVYDILRHPLKNLKKKKKDVSSK